MDDTAEPQVCTKPADRYGLVLSGGGLKLAIHAGLYAYLEATGVATPGTNRNEMCRLSDSFDCLVGTSAGAVIAAIMAVGIAAEDVAHISAVFTSAETKNLFLDMNFRGVGSYLITGNLDYIKGLFVGDAVRKLLEVFLSTNFLEGMGKLYGERATKRWDDAAFQVRMKRLVIQLYRRRRETLPDICTAKENSDKPLPAAKENSDKPLPKDRANCLGLITFQDINPVTKESAKVDVHCRKYQDALKKYAEGRTEYYNKTPVRDAWPVVAISPTRPLLLLIGTDIVTGQKTVFCNSQRFDTNTLYQRQNSYQGSAKETGRCIAYQYISEDASASEEPEYTLKELGNKPTETIRPINYLYRHLPKGLPLAWAVRSSLSIPGIFAPSTIQYPETDPSSTNKGKYSKRIDYFVDGGVSDNYAVQVAADPSIGNCTHILGGDISNLGPRTHDFNVGNVIQILTRSLLVMGDGLGDTNVDNRLVNNAKVTTLNEFLLTDVSITDPTKLSQLIRLGYDIADQYFSALWNNTKGKIPLSAVFDTAYMVFLPRMFTPDTNIAQSLPLLPTIVRKEFPILQPQAGTRYLVLPVAKPPNEIPRMLSRNSCNTEQVGSVEIQCLVDANENPWRNLSIQRAKSQQTAELALTPVPVANPITGVLRWIVSLIASWNPIGKFLTNVEQAQGIGMQIFQWLGIVKVPKRKSRLPALSAIPNLVRIVLLLIISGMLCLTSLVLWRICLSIVPGLTTPTPLWFAKSARASDFVTIFDSWNYTTLLLVLVIGTYWAYMGLTRAIISDLWPTTQGWGRWSRWFARIVVAYAIYLLPLLVVVNNLNVGAAFQIGPLSIPNSASTPALIALSASALLYIAYAIITPIAGWFFTTILPLLMQLFNKPNSTR